MSEQNRMLAIRWFEEVWNQRRIATIDELMAPDATGYMEGADVRGPEDFKAVRATILGAFPDFRIVVEDTVAEGDHVVVRWRASGVHSGDDLGFPATGRAVTFRGITWMTFANGLVVKGWDAWNQGGLLESLRTPPDRIN